MKKTLVLGASDNPSRYSFMAVQLLHSKGHEVVAVGKKSGVIDDVIIHKPPYACDAINTITLYLNPDHQKDYYNYIIDLHPQRVIFNPGTENEALQHLLDENGIDYMEACTLVMLHTGQY